MNIEEYIPRTQHERINLDILTELRDIRKMLEEYVRPTPLDSLSEETKPKRKRGDK